MAIKNPQTWTRLKRVELRQLANHVGNEAMRLMSKWPSTGEGRAVKALTETITRRLDGRQQLRDLDFAFGQLLASVDEFEAILLNPFFNSVVIPSSYKVTRDGVIDIGSAIAEAVATTRDFVDRYRASLPPPPTPAEEAASEIVEIVPDQKLGPLRFRVVDDVVRVEHQTSAVAWADKTNAGSARQELIRSSAELLAFLEQSNQDPRLSSYVKGMRTRLEADEDIIALGLAAITFQSIVDAQDEQLPGIWHGQLRGFALGITMYVGQFADWVRFSDNASQAEYSAADVSHLYAAGTRLNETLKAQVLVDPEVPRSLAFLLEGIHNPRRASKRAVFATIRSIENLLSAIIRSFGYVLGGIAEGGREGVKKATTGIVGGALLYWAATTALQVAPAAGQILQAGWLQRAGQLILEHLQSE